MKLSSMIFSANESCYVERRGGDKGKGGGAGRGRDGGRGAGTDNTEGIHFGGRNEPTLYASTEEFSSGAVSTKTISTD